MGRVIHYVAATLATKRRQPDLSPSARQILLVQQLRVDELFVSLRGHEVRRRRGPVVFALRIPHHQWSPREIVRELRRACCLGDYL